MKIPCTCLAACLALGFATLALMPATVLAWVPYEDSGTNNSRPLCVAGILNGNHAWLRNDVRTPGLMSTYSVALENRTTFPLVFRLKFTLPGTSLHIDEEVTMAGSTIKSFQLGMIYKDPKQAPSPIIKAIDIFKYISATCTQAMGRKL